MSTVFEKEAAGIVKNQPQPDADATTIKEKQDEPPKKKRGRPKGSSVKKKKVDNSEEYMSGAKAINTIVMSMTCAVTGTAEAWASQEKEIVMDKALARYLEIKNYDMPPELAIIAAYSAYFSEVAQKDKVRENVAKTYGGKFGKIAAKFSSLKNKFKLKKKENK